MLSAKPGMALVAILVVALSACAGKDRPTLAEQKQQISEALRQAMLNTVQGPERARQATSLMEEMLDIMDAAAQDQQAFRDEFLALNRNYSAQREQFENLFERYNVDIERHQKRILAAHRQMAEVLTAEEWATLSRLRKDSAQSGLSPL